MSLSVSSEILIEAVEEGALVFDSRSGATTLISQNALSVVVMLRRLGTVNESDLEAICTAVFTDGSELSSVLASLENVRLIFRC